MKCSTLALSATYSRLPSVLSHKRNRNWVVAIFTCATGRILSTQWNLHFYSMFIDIRNKLLYFCLNLGYITTRLFKVVHVRFYKPYLIFSVAPLIYYNNLHNDPLFPYYLHLYSFCSGSISYPVGNLVFRIYDSCSRITKSSLLSPPFLKSSKCSKKFWIELRLVTLSDYVLQHLRRTFAKNTML